MLLRALLPRARHGSCVPRWSRRLQAHSSMAVDGAADCDADGSDSFKPTAEATRLKHKLPLGKATRLRAPAAVSGGNDTARAGIATTVATKMEEKEETYTAVEAPKIPEHVLESVRADLKEMLNTLETRFPSTKQREQTVFQRQKGMQKAATGLLDSLLWLYRMRGDYDRVEAVAFLWDTTFPQFGSNTKHQTIICDHYAFVLNKQQRFSEVVDKLFHRQFPATDDVATPTGTGFIMSFQLAEAILLACGHLRDSATAARVHQIMQANDVPIRMVAYFHLLNAFVNDRQFRDVDLLLRVCEDLTAQHKELVPLSLLPSVVATAAQNGEVDRAMAIFELPAEAKSSAFTEFRFEMCLQTLWEFGHYAEMLQVYQAVMDAPYFSADLKQRVSKCFLHKSLRDPRRSETTESEREALSSTTTQILETMETHGVRANYKSVSALIPALVAERTVRSADAMVEFFARYPRVLEWNTCAVCDAIVASVRARDPELVDAFIIYGLDNNVPIRYTALESVIAFYYKLGTTDSFTKAADIVRAMRRNQHIPLGIAVTEIGMIVNTKLRRYTEVVRLHEDFNKLDSELQRTLERRIMLKSALTAYTALHRVDEANAVRKQLEDSYLPLMDGTRKTAAQTATASSKDQATDGATDPTEVCALPRRLGKKAKKKRMKRERAAARAAAAQQDLQAELGAGEH